MNWYNFGAVHVHPTRYGTVLIDTADLAQIKALSWHVRVGKMLYVRAWIDSRRVSADREKAIYLHDFLMRPGDGEEVDFRNGNGLDCRRKNMRLGSRSDNNCNRRVVNSNTGFLGVHFCKNRGKYVAQIRKNGRAAYIGRFEKLDDALAAREEAAAKLHGEFASTLNAELLAPDSSPAPVQERGES